MAKKTKQENKEFDYEAVKNRMDKYYKARESEKKGKALVLSLIGTSVLILAILLVVVLKLNGVGKTIVFSTDESGNVSTSVADSENVSGKNLAEVISDEIEE